MADMNGHMGCGAPGSADVDVAGGVGVGGWFVVLVGHNGERAVGRRLGERGYEVYVALQREVRVWRDGRWREVDRVVIPSVVFVRCGEGERRDVLRTSGVRGFLMNRAGRGGSSVAVVPDVQLDRLRFMLGATDRRVDFVGEGLRAGMCVRVVRGALCGLCGEVVGDGRSADGSVRLLVRVDALGCACVEISELDLEPFSA